MRFPIIIITIVGILLSACSDKHNQEEERPIAKSKHEQAMALKLKNAPASEYIAMQRKAVEDVRRGKSKEPAVAVLSQLGYFLSRTGEYAEAMLYLQEAADSLKANKLTEIDPEAVVKLYGNMSNLYIRIGLYDEALAKSNDAISFARRNYPDRLPDLWRMRSAIFDYENKLDSSLYCLDNALYTAQFVSDKELADNMAMFARSDRAATIILHGGYATDSIKEAIKDLESIIAIDNQLHGSRRFLLGRGYILLGDTDKGISMMEQELDRIRQEGITENIEWALQLMAKSYAETGHGNKLAAIYKETAQLHDTIISRQKADALIGADFRYRTHEQKEKNEMLENNLRLSKQRNIILVILIIMVIVGLTLYFIRQSKKHQRLIAQKQQDINNLITSSIFLNQELKRLSETLQAKEVQTDEENQPLIIQSLLVKEDEVQFRHKFSELYPGFLERLRDKYPGLSTGNELICMLIRLNKRNDEIALALGISRDSVTKARYRLRTRFSLPKDIDLNSFIRSL